MNNNKQSTKTIINGHNWLRNKSLKDVRNELRYLEENVYSNLLTKFTEIGKKYGIKSEEYGKLEKLYWSIISEIITKIEAYNKVSPTLYTTSESLGFEPHYMDLVKAA